MIAAATKDYLAVSKLIKTDKLKLIVPKARNSFLQL
jgi:hypothetical protein